MYVACNAGNRATCHEPGSAVSFALCMSSGARDFALLAHWECPKSVFSFEMSGNYRL